MKVTTEIDDDDLDTRFPDEDDDEDVPSAMVMVIVRASDGTGHSAAVQLHDSLVSPGRLAEAVVSAVHGATRTHSPDLASAVEQWLTVPPDLEVVKGGDDA